MQVGICFGNETHVSEKARRETKKALKKKKAVGARSSGKKSTQTRACDRVFNCEAGLAWVVIEIFIRL